MIERDKFYIGGDWVDPVSDNVIEVISPHSEKVVGVVPDAGPADLDGDVAAAQVLEMGCPISQVREVMVDPSIAALEYYADLASTYEQEERRDGRGGVVSV